MPTNTATKYDVQLLDLDVVEPDKRNVRRGKIDAQEVETLRVALRAALERGEEFDNPITVYPSGARRYTIKHGHRRYQAARLEGVPRLHFHIVAPPSERDRILDQLDDNLNARTLSHRDLATAFDELRKIDDLSIMQLVQALRARGVPGVENGDAAGKVWVRQHLDLLKLHPEVQDLVHTRQLGYSVAVKLKDQPLAEQIAFARRIVAEGTSSREVDVMLGRRPSDGESWEAGDAAESDWSAAPPVQAFEAPIEARFAGLRDELADRAAAAASGSPRPTGPRDPARRNSAVQTRAEFFGTNMLPTPVDAKARQRLETLNASRWAASASDGALTIARDLVNWGRRNTEEAIQIAEQSITALANCPDEYIRLMHTVRTTLDTARQGMPDPLGLVLNLWIERIPRGIAA